MSSYEKLSHNKIYHESFSHTRLVRVHGQHHISQASPLHKGKLASEKKPK